MNMTLMTMPDLSSPEIWLSFLTLTFLEIVLGVDNIIFISIASSKLKHEDQARATNIGLILAMVMRIALLFGISWIIAMESPWFYIDWPGVHGAFSGQSLILAAGGIFLLYKAVSEIHHKLESQSMPGEVGKGKKPSTLQSAIIEITLINIVFSFDSILTAVGMTSGLEGALVIMIVAVVASVVIMMLFAVPVGRFVNRHPTIQMLGLSFLILIGFMLIAEGAHIAHLTIAGQSVGAIPKGYLYFAIAFSLGVEFLNLRLRKPRSAVQLHGIKEEAVKEGFIEP
ncbi:MAG: TerC family protein [Saprospiraceae bacterium]|nr:TerC family protein [Saprospiraceae bacterium]